MVQSANSIRSCATIIFSAKVSFHGLNWGLGSVSVNIFYLRLRNQNLTDSRIIRGPSATFTEDSNRSVPGFS